MRMASPSASRRTARAPAMQAVFPDDVLEEIWEEIFVRLDAAADLARVCATSSSFRRIVSARRFLRRFQSLHSPPVLGFVGYGCREFLPVAPPHRSAEQAHALVQAADFTFSFLPDPHAWRTYNARDGRVLLSRSISPKIQNWDLVVCDPLHRRYVMIPRIPEDLLAASTPDNCKGNFGRWYRGTFLNFSGIQVIVNFYNGTQVKSSNCNAPHVLPILAPAAENDGEESFRVLCTVQQQQQLQDKFMAFVFSSCNQTWRGIISTTETASVPNGSIQYIPSYAHGCFYWMVDSKGYSLMLDTSEMKFSLIDLPPHNFDSVRAIIEAADGRLGFLTIGDGTVDLYCKNLQSNGVGAQEWQHDKLIPLPKDSGINWNILGTAGRYVALRASAYWYKMQDYEYFVLDMKTLLVDIAC